MTETTERDLPLTGYRVLDLTRILAGPYCTMILGDHGADVIKVERPGSGDDTRAWGPPFAGGESAYYLCCNRNKRSITIDLKSPRGVALVQRLAATADVVIENFTPGLMARFGLDYASLSARNPRLVYCSISAYGQEGPYRSRPGYDLVLSAVGGLMGITGEDGRDPVRVGVAITDVVTGVHASGAVLAALLWRERSGRGQYIDASLLDVQAASLANIASSYLVGGKEAQRWGTAHESIVPYQVFSTKDQPIVIAAANQRLWERLCEVLGSPGWAQDPRFLTNPLRVAHRDVLIPLLAARLHERSCEEWMRLLVEAAVPCGPVNNMEQLFSDPQLLHREMVAEVEHPTIPALRLVGIPIKFSETPGEIRRPPPTLGQHTDEILRDLLDCSAEEISLLHADGVV